MEQLLKETSGRFGGTSVWKIPIGAVNEVQIKMIIHQVIKMIIQYFDMEWNCNSWVKNLYLNNHIIIYFAIRI